MALGILITISISGIFRSLSVFLSKTFKALFIGQIYYMVKFLLKISDPLL